MAEVIQAHQKALAINLDRSIYGTFAEIGAGQEVARWFYRVGGAAGTVAETISAYDMAVSDAVYGKAGRYVSRERLLAMLDREFRKVVERLDAARGAESRFFAFADTVSARNYAGTNECHGWVGLRFQAEPRGGPSTVVLHVNLRDGTNLLQQEVLGILGVNLVHGVYHARGSMDALLEALFADLSTERIEIDHLELDGPVFGPVDPDGSAVALVRGAYAPAVILPASGPIAPPTEVLRKRPIILERGRFEGTDPVHGRMISAAVARLAEEDSGVLRDPLALFEMSLRPVRKDDPVPDDATLRRRAARLRALGMPVLLTSLPESYRLTAYLRRYTQEPVRFVLGTPVLVELLEAGYYPDLIGGVLEALGRLLADNVRIYVYPAPAELFHRMLARSPIDRALLHAPTEGLVGADAIRLDPPLGHLFEYLKAAGWLVPIGEALAPPPGP